MSADLNLSGNIELEIDESQVMAAIDSANRKASDLSGGGGGGGASRRGSSAQMAGISTGESQGIASAVRNALGDVKLPPFPAMPTGLSQAIAGGARGGVPPGLVFAAGRLSTRTFVPPVPPALPSGAAGAARVSGQAAAGIGGPAAVRGGAVVKGGAGATGAALGLSGAAVAGIGVAAGAAVLGVAAKAGFDSITKGVDRRLERQLGAGFQFSPELSRVAFEQEVRERDRAIDRGSILGDSAQELGTVRGEIAAATNIGGAVVSDQVNELLIPVLKAVKPFIGNVVESLARISAGLGGMDRKELQALLEDLKDAGFDVDSDPAEPLFSPSLNFDNVNIGGLAL